MKFIYEYRTKDNVLKEGRIAAVSRDAVYSALRNQGIRPARVVEAPGVMNRLLGKGKRWLAIVILALVCVTLVVTLYRQKDESVSTRQPRQDGGLVAVPRPRKQLSGFDTLPLERIFAHPTEVYLARFSQPGVLVPRSDEEDIENLFEEDLEDALEDSIRFRPDDGDLVSELKCVVAGLKEEAYVLFSAGKTYREIREWFEARQQMEADYRASILNGTGTSDEKLAKLRLIGLAE